MAGECTGVGAQRIYDAARRIGAELDNLQLETGGDQAALNKLHAAMNAMRGLERYLEDKA